MLTKALELNMGDYVNHVNSALSRERSQAAFIILIYIWHLARLLDLSADSTSGMSSSLSALSPFLALLFRSGLLILLS